jgi:hypothetical protein
MWPEIAVDPLRLYVPLPRRAIGEQSLQAIDDRSSRALLQRRHRPSVRQSRPGDRTDDPVDRQTRALLDLLDRRLHFRSNRFTASPVAPRLIVGCPGLAMRPLFAGTRFNLP